MKVPRHLKFVKWHKEQKKTPGQTHYYGHWEGSVTRACIKGDAEIYMRRFL
ncbi:MAG: hypothetical protein RBG13Loki_1096 [Promethearchaeota archaeon CR_4]|nr:MAG: hypothetical protein RBG13Loki_1096 [Candidatus Lokiarchaeota archaeon CR_4]